MKFPIKDFFSQCVQIRTADLITLIEDILNEKLKEKVGQKLIFY